MHREILKEVSAVIHQLAVLGLELERADLDPELVVHGLLSLVRILGRSLGRSLRSLELSPKLLVLGKQLLVLSKQLVVLGNQHLVVVVEAVELAMQILRGLGLSVGQSRELVVVVLEILGINLILEGLGLSVGQTRELVLIVLVVLRVSGGGLGGGGLGGSGLGGRGLDRGVLLLVLVVPRVELIPNGVVLLLVEVVEDTEDRTDRAVATIVLVILRSDVGTVATEPGSGDPAVGSGLLVALEKLIALVRVVAHHDTPHVIDVLLVFVVDVFLLASRLVEKLLGILKKLAGGKGEPMLEVLEGLIQHHIKGLDRHGGTRGAGE